MANYPEYSAYLKTLLVAAARGELSAVGSDEEDACARRIALGSLSFLRDRLALSVAAPTDVVTWKRLSDSYGAFDVQIGWVGNAYRGASARGRMTARINRAGGNRFSFDARDWGSDYATSYTLQLLSQDGGYRLDDVVRPALPYPDDWEVEV